MSNHKSTSRIFYYLSWPPVTIGRKLYNIISNVDNTGLFLKHLLIQTVFTLTSNYILFNVRNNIMQGFGKMDNILFSVLSTEGATEKDWDNFKDEGVKILQPILIYIGLKLIINSTINVYDSWIASKLKQNLNKKVFNDNQVGVKLANSAETAEIVRNLPKDIFTSITSSLNLIKDAIRNTQDASLSIYTMYRLSSPINILGIKVPDLLLISVGYSIVKQYISSFITNKTASLSSELTMHNTKVNTIIAHDFSNVKPIFTAGAQNLVAQRHSRLIDVSDKHNIKYQFLVTIHGVWLNLTQYTNIIFKYIVAGYKVFTKEIKSDKIYQTFSHFGNVDNFLSWPDLKQAEIKRLEPSLNRLQKFLDKEKEILNTTVNLKFTSHTANLSLRNLNLKVEDKTLLSINKMEFQSGSRYVISGQSGSGKSSLIAKINGIVHDGIDANGEINCPLGIQKKIMLTQDDYFPAHSTILDVICFPNKIPDNILERNALINKAQELLREAKLGRELNLDEEKTNWSAELSGGQKKKIKIISAILQNPQLLLLDEVFVGLDNQSIKVIQDMIIKYLPNTTIIAVDHHPEDSRGFYTHHYEIANSSEHYRWG